MTSGDPKTSGAFFLDEKPYTATPVHTFTTPKARGVTKKSCLRSKPAPPAGSAHRRPLTSRQITGSNTDVSFAIRSGRFPIAEL